MLINAHISAQDFLNGVCTHIIWLTKKKLTYYTGNYDTFRKTVRENEVIQMKKYAKEQDDIKHLKEFIASCGTYSNLVKQARPLTCLDCLLTAVSMCNFRVLRITLKPASLELADRPAARKLTVP